jgi:hypothetical protein
MSHQIKRTGMAVAGMLILLLTYPSLSSATIVTQRVCTLIGLAFSDELGGCIPVFVWDYRDILVSSQQLNQRLGGVLTAVGVRTPPEFPVSAFGSPFAGLDTAEAPPGWSIIQDPASLPFADANLAPGRFIYFIPPNPIATPQDLGDFEFRTKLANDDSLILEVRGANFVIGETGPVSDFGPLLINPPIELLFCIPEPSALALFVIAALGLLSCLWWRVQKEGARRDEDYTLSVDVKWSSK